MQLYDTTNRPDQAAEWKQKLAEFEKAEAEKQCEQAATQAIAGTFRRWQS